MAIQEPTFFILTALVDTPLHGYGIMQAIERLSGGRVTLRAGTLYAALERLTEEGRLRVDREEAIDSRLRRYYILTTDGRKALEAEVSRMRANTALAETKLRRGVKLAVDHA